MSRPLPDLSLLFQLLDKEEDRIGKRAIVPQECQLALGQETQAVLDARKDLRNLLDHAYKLRQFIEQIRQEIDDDSKALTYQSFGQYRTALCKYIRTNAPQLQTYEQNY